MADVGEEAAAASGGSSPDLGLAGTVQSHSAKCCGSKYIEFGSRSRILVQFGSGSRVVLSTLKEKIRN